MHYSEPQEQPQHQQEQAATDDRDDCEDGSDRVIARRCSYEHYDADYFGCDDHYQSERRCYFGHPTSDGPQPRSLFARHLSNGANNSNCRWYDEKDQRHPSEKQPVTKPLLLRNFKVLFHRRKHEVYYHGFD